MTLTRRSLKWAFILGALTALALRAAMRANESPRKHVEFSVHDCSVLKEPGKLDISKLRLPPGTDLETTAALLNTYRRTSHSRQVKGEWVLLGRLDDKAAGALRQRLSQAPLPQALRITSFGGSDHAAIEFAEQIAAHRLPVVVDTVCGSACANYLLPAAPLVRLEGIVLMHGSPAGCSARLGTWGAWRELELDTFLTLRHAAQRQRDFEQRHPHFKALVARSDRPDRGDPSGQAHGWLRASPADMTAAHPGVSVGPGHARAEAAYRALLQAEPELGEAYFPP